MLSRTFKSRKTKKSSKHGEGCSRSESIREEEDCNVGHMSDLPLSFCGLGGSSGGGGGGGGGGGEPKPTLKEVLQLSVEVLGESSVGMSEKVVFLDGKVYTAKRFWRVTVSRGEFEMRVERLTQVCRRSLYLVPVRGYLYDKRIKLVLCDYYPMGSLADLLLGGRKLGHTPLNWDQRLRVIFHITRAIAFIHKQSFPQEKNLQMNVHGNIKASNVLIKTDFSACLSDYGFVQLAEPAEDLGERQQRPKTVKSAEKLSQKVDIYNFGVIVLDMLGGPKTPFQINYILECKEEIQEGVIEIFEFLVEGRKRKQALQVLDIALACTNRSPEGRPSIDQILSFLRDVLNKR